jgi:hypothetical protein
MGYVISSGVDAFSVSLGFLSLQTSLKAPPEIVFLPGSVVGSVLEASFTGV